MDVADTHCQSGKSIMRFKSIDKARDGTGKLNDLINKGNNGLEMCVILPMFIYTTNDTIMFALKGYVDSKEGESYIINKEDQT